MLHVCVYIYIYMCESHTCSRCDAALDAAGRALRPLETVHELAVADDHQGRGLPGAQPPRGQAGAHDRVGRVEQGFLNFRVQSKP